MDNIYGGNSVIELVKSDFIIRKKGLNKYNVFLKKDLNRGLNGILIIYAPWCEQCVINKNMWESMGRLFKYKFNIYSLNTYNFKDKNQDMTLPLDIHIYPDYRFVKRNGEIEDYNGGKSESDIVKFIIKNI